MAKPEREFFPVDEVEWTPAQGGLVTGLFERILSTDPQTGVATRMLRFDPGTDTSAAGPQVHPFWEEVFIVEGALHDLTLDQTFPKGTYACRPPGMSHGPWVAPDGCLTFEVRYVS
jgi:ChrR-like protein with cupin domain